MQTAKQEPRWERRKDARPKELIDAALEIFVEKGYAAARLDEVAKRAGVSKGTVYLYFTNKEELFKAVIRDGIVSDLANIEEIIDHFEGKTSDLLRVTLKSWWDNVGATPLAALLKVIVSEAGNFPEIVKFYYDEVISRRKRIILQILQRGIDNKEFRSVDLNTTLFLIVAPFPFLFIWEYSFAQCAPESVDPAAIINAHIDATLRGLARN